MEKTEEMLAEMRQHLAARVADSVPGAEGGPASATACALVPARGDGGIETFPDSVRPARSNSVLLLLSLGCDFRQVESPRDRWDS